MRETKKKRWPLFVVVGLLFILLIFAVDGIQRRFIYNDRTVQLQAYYGQLDSVITHRFNRHYRLLTSWTYHLKHKEESGIANFSHYIEMERVDIGKLVEEVESPDLARKISRNLIESEHSR